MVTWGQILQVTFNLEKNSVNDDLLLSFIAGANTRSMNGKPDVRFSKSGTLKNVELNIMNLRQGMQGSGKQWEKIGAWRSWEKDNYGLDIQDIVWPG